MEFINRTMSNMANMDFTTVARWVFLFLALFILARQIRSLMQVRNPSEIWAHLGCPDGSSVPLTHWENLIGRGRGCDVILNLKSVSRSHATLIRDSAGVWKFNDLNSKNGSAINGRRVNGPTVLNGGDVLTIGGADFTLYPVSLQERMKNIEKRKKKTRPVSPWPTLVALTLFQLLTVIQFRHSLGEDCPDSLGMAFALLCILMWAYVVVMRLFRRVGFEMEMIAFFLSTLSLAVTASAYPGSVFKQAICVVLGVALFFGLCWYLRDLNRTKKIIYILIGISVFLLILNLIIGTVTYGSRNWIVIGGFSLQPSELVKIVFVFVGAATLDELQQKRNLTIFMGFSVFCLGCLAIMGDFGTAIIFFVTFLVISFLRSGDFSKLVLILGAAGLMGLMVLRFKPYIATRFETWGHVWDYPTEGGFQQVQTMTSAASGGLPGLGAGEGNLSDVAAASTDLVFGLLAEEWGLIIAILSVLCIITLGVFAVRCIVAGRSTYYSIAACSATSLFIFQTILNVFGSVDLLPLTGVTFPFVSSGGTSMITSWGLLAFLKAADTRQNASFAIRLDKKGEFDEYEDELKGAGYYDAEEFLREADMLNPQQISPDGNSSPVNREAAEKKATRIGRKGKAGKVRHMADEYADERMRRGSDDTRPLQNPGYTRDGRQDTIIQQRQSSPQKRSIKYQDMDSFLEENLSGSGYGNEYESRYGNAGSYSSSRHSDRSYPGNSRTGGSSSSGAYPDGSGAGSGYSGNARSGGGSRSSNARADSNRAGSNRAGNKSEHRYVSDDYPSGGEQFEPLTLDDLFGGDDK